MALLVIASTRQMNLSKKIISYRIWQAITIMTAVYLLLAGYMQYHWYPDDQAKTYTTIMGLIFTTMLVIRFLRPNSKVLPLLILFDFALLTIASRALLNNSFWHSILLFGTTNSIIAILIIYVADYLLRYFYFNYDRIDFH